jgi:hypothetical protein
MPNPTSNLSCDAKELISERLFYHTAGHVRHPLSPKLAGKRHRRCLCSASHRSCRRAEVPIPTNEGAPGLNQVEGIGLKRYIEAARPRGLQTFAAWNDPVRGPGGASCTPMLISSSQARKGRRSVNASRRDDGFTEGGIPRMQFLAAGRVNGAGARTARPSFPARHDRKSIHPPGTTRR